MNILNIDEPVYVEDPALIPEIKNALDTATQSVAFAQSALDTATQSVAFSQSAIS